MTSKPPPVLIGCSHGTSDPDGRTAIESILTDVRELRPDLDVREAFVDVQEPEVADVVLDALAAGSGTEAQAVVVVPLLLSAGFHTYVDVADSVRVPGAVAAPTLGPDPRLADILVERLREAGATEQDTVIVAAAGSSDPRTTTAVGRTVEQVRARWAGLVMVGYGSIAQPAIGDVVAQVRAQNTGPGRIVIASYLLAPGFFHGVLARAGADVVTQPLAPHPQLAQIVLDRFAAAADGSEILDFG